MIVQNNRSSLLDLIKGLAIVSVLLFHIGLFRYGYLGVDVFFVIAGYLTTCSVIKQYDNNNFCYWRFLLNRLIRLWPLLLITCMLSLIVGYNTMLPASYKNTAETAFGTSFFVNNYAQYITAGDYWDSSNEYKPLMHTWYVGVLFQFYILFPLLCIIVRFFTKKWKHLFIYVLFFITLISFVIYVLPVGSEAFDFYMLPSRLFEFTIGAILATPLFTNVKINWFNWGTIIVLVVLLTINSNIEAMQYRLLFTVFVSTILIWNSRNSNVRFPFIFKPLILCGMASYSIYIWHQVIFAFYRNIWNDQLILWEYILLILVSLTVGIVSYYGIEKTIERICKQKTMNQKMVIVSCILSLIPICFFSIKYYNQEGVVRDIPELAVFLNNSRSWVPQAYNAAVYQEDRNFLSNGKKNILLVGDSYARDWYNVIKESDKSNCFNLSYHEKPDSVLRERIRQADCIFLATHGSFERFNPYLPEMMKKKFYRVGDKRFFSSPNIIYNKRENKNYLMQQVNIPNDIKESNDDEQRIFGNAFINSMNIMKTPAGLYNIFTPEGFLISHDGLHLTKAGAMYYGLQFSHCKLYQDLLK